MYKRQSLYTINTRLSREYAGFGTLAEGFINSDVAAEAAAFDKYDGDVETGIEEVEIEADKELLGAFCCADNALNSCCCCSTVKDTPAAAAAFANAIIELPD